MAEILFYPIGSMIMTITLFLSFYMLRYKCDDDDVDDSSLLHHYDIIEKWENMKDDEPTNDILCDLVNRKIEFETIHGTVVFAYDYPNGMFIYWTDRKDSISYDMLIDLAREYSVMVEIKRIFCVDTDKNPSDKLVTPVKPSGPFLRKPAIRPVNIKVRLNSFKYKGGVSDMPLYSVTTTDTNDTSLCISWNDWKSKNV